jgi:putative transposase
VHVTPPGVLALTIRSLQHPIGQTLRNFAGSRLTCMVVSGNGIELTSNAILRWQEKRKVERRHFAQGKPMQNGFVQSFNGGMRDDLLTEHLFDSLRHARILIAAGRDDFNHHSPHSSLAGLTL